MCFNQYVLILTNHLIISSGFRCAELCIAIGSSVNSQHVADEGAAAADFEIPGVDNLDLAIWIKK